MIELANKVINNGLTKVTLERFQMIIRHQANIQSLNGDIIECGVWKGGMGLFLTKLFSTKKIWLADSFSGFQDPKKAKYNFDLERHKLGGMSVPFNDVIELFKHENVNIDNINFLIGYVNDTLPNADIRQLSMLRVDVDAYSATIEVLEHLYDKVIVNGYIIFDDTCLIETRHAINDFFNSKNIDIKLRHPVTDEIIDFRCNENMPCGCYMIKE